MTLFISDMHLGRYGPEQNRQEETTLLACLEHYRGRLEHLVLVGDVFDQYIEYRYLAPKGFVRFQAFLASLTDSGIPVTYLLGNHDPWHIDYFKNELGVKTFSNERVLTEDGISIYVTHGDQVYSRLPLSRLITYLMRHPVMITLYRSLLPGDLGTVLANKAKSFLHSDVINEKVTSMLADHAAKLIHAGQAQVVVMGHSHVYTIDKHPRGHYLNPGCWYLDKTFGILENKTLRLVCWKNEAPAVISSEHVREETLSVPSNQL